MELVTFNENSRVIGKSGNFYIITNDQEATLEDMYAMGAIIDKEGKQITPYTYLNLFQRDEKWEPVSDTYKNVINPKKQDLTKDSLLGFAVGDAFGVPVEFLSRFEVRKINLQDMVGNDTPNMFRSRWGRLIPSGSYSDDTAMLISTMDSIIDNKGQINERSIMDNFVKWVNEGKYSSLEFPFGMGGIVLSSLKRYVRGVPPLDCGGKEYMDNGNGSLMRILPFSLYCITNDLSEEETCDIVSKGSQLTHANDISKMSCFIYTEYLRAIVKTKNPTIALNHIQNIEYSKYFSQEAINAHKQILGHGFLFISDEKIKDSGYVVDTLESVLYSVIKGKDYESTIKTAINLGYDTDTVGGITGSIAGILYGSETIPERWISKLRRKDYLEELADKFSKTLENNKVEKKNYELK